MMKPQSSIELLDDVLSAADSSLPEGFQARVLQALPEARRVRAISRRRRVSMLVLGFMMLGNATSLVLAPNRTVDSTGISQAVEQLYPVTRQLQSRNQEDSGV